MATQNPQREKLGRLLRAAREAARLKPVEVEAAMRWYPGKLSRVENGRRVPVGVEIERLAELYEVDGEARASLVELADAARKREAPSRVADFAQSYVTYEREASRISYYDGYLVFGLFQTEEYARAVLSTSGSAQVEAWLEERVGRRGILTREKPPTVRVLLGEAALYQQVAGEGALLDQLRHLRQMAELPNVAVRVMPFAAGAHRALGVGFTILSMDASDSTRVYIEGLTDATYIQEPDETAIYEAGFADIWSAALDEADSATMLDRRIGNG